MKYTYTKKQLDEIIDNIFEKEKNLNKLNKDDFKNTYYSKIINKLKTSSSRYLFTREEYQTRIRLYFYYSQEKNIYVILVLALIERRLFDEWNNW